MMQQFDCRSTPIAERVWMTVYKTECSMSKWLLRCGLAKTDEPTNAADSNAEGRRRRMKLRRRGDGAIDESIDENTNAHVQQAD